MHRHRFETLQSREASRNLRLGDDTLRAGERLLRPKGARGVSRARSMSAGASLRRATRFSALSGSPAASARAAAVISESIEVKQCRRRHLRLRAALHSLCVNLVVLRVGAGKFDIDHTNAVGDRHDKPLVVPLDVEDDAILVKLFGCNGSKAALNMMTVQLAVELAADGISPPFLAGSSMV